MRAGDDGDIAAWVEAQLHAFVEDGCLLDQIADAVSAQLAAALRLCAPFGKAVPVGGAHGGIEDAGEITTVIGVAGLGLVRHLLAGDEIASPDFRRIEAKPGRCAIEQALDRSDRFRAASAAIGTDRRRMREHGAIDEMDRRYLINARQQPCREHNRCRAGGCRIGADPMQSVGAERQNFSVIVEGKFDVHNLISPVQFAEDRFRTRGGPFHRPSDRARGP